MSISLLLVGVEIAFWKALKAGVYEAFVNQGNPSSALNAPDWAFEILTAAVRLSILVQLCRLRTPRPSKVG
jgi:hypothetical protein